MNHHSPHFTVELAKNDADLRAAQRLRYDVFVDELGGGGPMVDRRARLERDRFDAHADHLLLRDMARPADDLVIGTYRLMTNDAAQAAGQFYCEDEYDLAPLQQSDHRLLELGRSCLHPDYRGGSAMLHLWGGLADYIAAHQIDLLFGVASFHGTDIAPLRAPLSLLHHRHLAPEHQRVRARPPAAQPMDLLPADQIDRVAAMRDTPALIKAYLRLGGMVGDGAFVDHAFNTVDICLILPTQAINGLQKAIYAKDRAHV